MLAPMVCSVCFTKACRVLVTETHTLLFVSVMSFWRSYQASFCIDVLLTCVLYVHFHIDFVRCNIVSVKNREIDNMQ